MVMEKWIIRPGESRVVDVVDIRKLKVGLVGGQVDVIAHDSPEVRIEVHNVTIKDLRIEANGDALEIDHAQLRWDNFLEVFRNFGSSGPKAEVSIAVPRGTELTLGVVSASALVAGLATDARLNTVSGDIIVDGHTGDLSVNAVSGDVQVRGLVGALSANSVSGDVAATGTLRSASADTVSGAILIDSDGSLTMVGLNTVSGDTTVRIDEGYPANFLLRTVSGRVTVDGIKRSTSGPTNYVDSVGELSGQFVDLRANTVSGEITVLRRPVTAAVDSDVPASEAL